ncbi:hypothetical protein C8A03DRAFT_48441 [Achaetomium macrosporum]|uniref:Uncharacterized protein n=1 Tax=Achaetomium macrosporum TaxID=79813 RepID=A0AAN7C0G3_9PEZI|nr:hypothetical protein C8A03DRAFT_48441 [Achaetomium macrosporum]
MCHGHPHYHSCGHQSVTWHYCPSAVIDLTTGYETPCTNITFAASQPSTSSCPLANCDFRNAGDGGWTCCKCGGRNSSGWCKKMSPNPKWERNPITNEWEWIERCDHGCCRNCVKDAPTEHKVMPSEADPVTAYEVALDYNERYPRGCTSKKKE